MSDQGELPLPDEATLIGAKIRPNGTLDTSRALRVPSVPELPEKGKEKVSPPIPQHWTTLYHGTNLGRKEWLERAETLDQYTFTVEGMGLSAISEQERQKQQELSRDPRMNYNTTRGYSSGFQGQPVEIRVIFPAFNSRWVGTKDVMETYSSRYGSERAQNILELSDVTYWKNQQKGRHPLIPRGMVLDRLDNTVLENGTRCVTYVPHDLRNVYENELNLEGNK